MNLNTNQYPLFTFNNAILLFLSVLLSVFLLFYLSNQITVKNCVVDNQQLFEQFKMTKEVKIRGEKLLKSQQIKIDSLNVQLALASSEQSKSQIYNLILYEKEQIQHFNENYTNLESEKIWKRIEIYVQDFAKLNQYDLIRGSQRLGDVWYTNPKLDVTEELIIYINKKYEGFN